MGYTTLGDTGMEISRIYLGYMNSGMPEWREWVLGEEVGFELVGRAIEFGINFPDTVSMYPNDESERVLGKVLEGRRDKTVVASKAYFQIDDDDPNSGGLSRKVIEQELDNSSDRLGADALDLLQIRRYDHNTPIGTTTHTPDDAVRRGKMHYVGTSSMRAHQFARAQYIVDSFRLDRFAMMQNHYNLLYREEERETLPLCEKQGAGVMPRPPFVHGYPTCPHEEFEAIIRNRINERAKGHSYFKDGGRGVNGRVEELADEKGVKIAQLVLLWVLYKDQIDTPAVSTSSIEHLKDAVKALDIALLDPDVDYLEEPHRPVHTSGHD